MTLTELHPDVAEKILGMANLAKPTDAEKAELLQGWREMFTFLNLTPDKQMTEFDAIMRARIQAGSISVLAPSAPSIRP